MPPRRRKARNPVPGAPDALGHVRLVLRATGDTLTLPYVYVGVVDDLHHYDALLTPEHSDLLLSGAASIFCDQLPGRSSLRLQLVENN